jgi:hypothetical protein
MSPFTSVENDHHREKYQDLRPGWAVQISYAPGGALGRSDLSGPGGSGAVAKAFSLAGAFQPKSVQRIGVIGLGPVFNVYPFLPQRPDVNTQFYSIWSAGISGQYQARFFREQLLVPTVALQYERLTYHLLSTGSGGINLFGPTVGLNILLNELEPSSAFEFYDDYGVLRSYLIAEIRALKGSDQNLNISGASYFVGLRVEF